MAWWAVWGRWKHRNSDIVIDGIVCAICIVYVCTYSVFENRSYRIYGSRACVFACAVTIVCCDDGIHALVAIWLAGSFEPRCVSVSGQGRARAKQSDRERKIESTRGRESERIRQSVA